MTPFPPPGRLQPQQSLRGGEGGGGYMPEREGPPGLAKAAATCQIRVNKARKETETRKLGDKNALTA